MKAQKQKQLDSLFGKLNADKQFYGNVLIAEKGKILYQKSFGKANAATGETLNAESVFELASVSKQFTAMGILLLQKEGKLRLEDSLRKYFPELPYSGITVKHLLQHTSGLPDYMNLMLSKGNVNTIMTNADMIALLAKHKPKRNFVPGEKWEYSNTGYALLASIIEQVSGRSFGDYLAASIFGPLKMKNTFVYRRRFESRVVNNYAYGYIMNPKTKEYVLPDSLLMTAKMVYCLDGITGDGTVNSTTGDLLKWDRALYTEKLISKEMLAAAFTPGMLNNGKAHHYGYGWAVGEFQNRKIINHSGGWPGYATFIERHTETDKTIIILSNYESEAPAAEVRNILYGIIPEVKKEVQLTDDVLKQYEGVYELQKNFVLKVTLDGSRLFVQATGQEKFEMFAEKKDLFFLKEVEAGLEFVRNEKNEIIAVILNQDGMKTEAKKIK